MLQRNLSIIFLFICSLIHAQQPPIPIPESIKVTSDIDYASYKEQKVQLDIYQPKAEGQYPGVILIHGGGWVKGSRAGYQSTAVELAQRGYVVANIDYRLATDTVFPGAVEDAKAAVRWLRANADEYNVNPNKIGSIGGSAGGYLAAMVAVTGHSNLFSGTKNNPDFSSEIQASIIMGTGVDQVARVKKAKNQHVNSCNIFFGGEYADKSSVYEQGSPITHVSKHMNPILMMDGENDRPGQRYVNFIPLLDSAGVEYEFKIILGARHTSWVKEEFRRIYIDAYDAFLKKHLGSVK